MANGHTNSNDVQARLGSAEQQIASLAAQQRALTENVSAVASSVREVGQTMASGFQKVDNQIDALGSKISEQGKPQWQTLIAVFGAIVVIVGWFAKSEIGPILTEQETTRRYISELKQADERASEHDALARERIARLEEIRRLEEAGLLKQKGTP